MGFFRSKREQRQEILAERFPEQWLSFLNENVILYRLLSEKEQERLKDALHILIAEKFWEGCAGLEVTDEMRVTVAGQASLLLLGFEDYYFDELKTILLYPGGYLGLDPDVLGGEDRGQHRLGEAHRRGPVVLSWWKARWDGQRLGSTNLVLHEFAHNLVQMDDPAAAMPPTEDFDLAEGWETVLRAEYDRLVEDAAYERQTLLHPYGAKSRAEFFAVATECFFLKPVALRRQHAALYEIFSEWYHQDPAGRRACRAVSNQGVNTEEEHLRQEIGECTAAISRWPGHVDAYRHRAACFCDLKEFESALADCTAVIRLGPKDDLALAYFERGRVHLWMRSYELAVADFTEAIRLVTDFARAYRGRGSARRARGEHDLALADLTRALQLDPKDDAAFVERAWIYHDAGKHDKALRDLTRAVRLAPHVAATYSDRARVHLTREEYDQAIADGDEAIRIDPELPEPYTHRGVAHLAKGEHGQAMADLTEAIRLDPGYAGAYRERARAQQARGENELARQDCERAEELERNAT